MSPKVSNNQNSRPTATYRDGHCRVRNLQIWWGEHRRQLTEDQVSIDLRRLLAGAIGLSSAATISSCTQNFDEFAARCFPGIQTFSLQLSFGQIEEKLLPFSALINGNPHAAGEIYQRLSRAEPKNCTPGLHYTPQALVQHMLTELIEDRCMRWLDPSCGCGAFPLALSQMCKDAGYKSQQEFHGADLDAPALELMNAAFRAAKSAQESPPVKLGSAVVQDSLCVEQNLPAHWPAGFDRVIMNPPYVNGVEDNPLGADEREQLRQRFSTATGPFDLYVPFLQRGVELLKEGGKLAVVLPDKWLATGYGSELRKFLARETQLLRLDHIPGGRHFGGADVEALVLVLQKKSTGDPNQRLCVRQLNRELGVLHEHLVSQSDIEQLAEPGWGPLLFEDRQIALAENSIPTLGDSREVRASLSVSEYYNLEIHEYDEMPAGIPLVTSGILDPWRCDWGLRPSRIRSRLWRAPVALPESLGPRRKKQVDSHRVLLANMSRSLEACPVVPGEAQGIVNVIQVFCKDRKESLLLAAWLNSSAINNWMQLWYKPLRMTGQLSLNRSMVARIPAPPADPVFQVTLDALGEKLRSGHVECPEGTSALLCELRKQLDDVCEQALTQIGHTGNGTS